MTRSMRAPSGRSSSTSCCATAPPPRWCIGTVHKQSADAFFAAAEKLNLRMIAGKVMMDRNAPERFTDTAERAMPTAKR